MTGLVVVHLRDVRLPALGVADQPLGVVVGKAPEEIFIHVAEAVALAREDEHVETLVGADQGVDHADGVGRVDVVVDVAVHQHQVAFQVGCDLRIGLDAVDEGRVALVDLLQDTVMLLAPPAVVDAVVVVAGAGDSRLEEIRIFQKKKKIRRKTMDSRTEKFMKLMEQLGADIDIPDEFEFEKPDEEVIHEWDELEGGGTDEA